MVFTHCSPRRRRRKLVGAALTLSLVFGGASVAGAQSDPSDVDTSATVGSGGGTAPNIECTWALNDVDHNWTGLPGVRQRRRHPDGPDAPGGVTDAHRASPSGSREAGRRLDRCDRREAERARRPDVRVRRAVGGRRSNSPTNTIVRWDVYHPDGSPEGAGRRHTLHDDDRPLRGSAGMFQAAVATGQVTSRRTEQHHFRVPEPAQEPLLRRVPDLEAPAVRLVPHRG